MILKKISRRFHTGCRLVNKLLFFFLCVFVCFFQHFPIALLLKLQSLSYGEGFCEKSDALKDLTFKKNGIQFYFTTNLHLIKSAKKLAVERETGKNETIGTPMRELLGINT